jgi:formylglycine-generating enzyme required for sulfatase activity
VEVAMKRSAFCWLSPVFLAAFAVLGTHSLPAQPKKVLPDPTPRADEILMLFMKEFIGVTPGHDKFPKSFQMGSKGVKDAQPAHEVTFKYAKDVHGFDLAKYEVTQELYLLVMGNNPSKWVGPRNSAEMMNWNEANEFCRKVTALLRQKKLLRDDEEVRLPTEAEWEYACRAGTGTDYSFGADVSLLGQFAWYRDNSKGHDPPVGAKKGNPWGFHEMHGYISEWCADDWAPGYAGAPTDGSARVIPGAKEKVIRGGSFADPPEVLKCAYRGHVPAGTRSDTIGFRCVRAKATAKKGG